MTTIEEKRAAFRRLHQSGCFVIPNPWDLGSARALERLGFRALATTSSGFAWSMGRPDNGVTVDSVLAHLAAMAGAVDLPLNADFEGGFAREPEGVAANVARAAATGIAGLSIEDATGDRAQPLYDFGLAVERVAAARAAIDKSGAQVLLTARHEGFLVGQADREHTIRRLRAMSDAGADCLYAPGLRERDDIAAIVEAVAPKPVNVLVFDPGWKVDDLAALGVRRISVGGGLARAAWEGFLRAAREIAEHGSFEGLRSPGKPTNLNRLLETEPLGQ